MAFEDGKRLFRSVQAIGLEGVVAKKLTQRYKPGERLWVKVKNRDYWRFPLERGGQFAVRTLRDSRRAPRGGALARGGHGGSPSDRAHCVDTRARARTSGLR